MSSLTIRNLDPAVKAALRVRAAQRGRSMEEEARAILRQALTPDDPPPAGISLAEAVQAAFAPLGGFNEFEFAPRSLHSEPPDFSGPEYDYPEGYSPPWLRENPTPGS